MRCYLQSTEYCCSHDSTRRRDRVSPTAFGSCCSPEPNNRTSKRSWSSFLFRERALACSRARARVQNMDCAWHRAGDLRDADRPVVHKRPRIRVLARSDPAAEGPVLDRARTRSDESTEPRNINAAEPGLQARRVGLLLWLLLSWWPLDSGLLGQKLLMQGALQEQGQKRGTCRQQCPSLTVCGVVRQPDPSPRSQILVGERGPLTACFCFFSKCRRNKHLARKREKKQRRRPSLILSNCASDTYLAYRIGQTGKQPIDGQRFRSVLPSR